MLVTGIWKNSYENRGKSTDWGKHDNRIIFYGIIRNKRMEFSWRQCKADLQ